MQPNRFDVSGEGIQISYMTAGIDGQPSFTCRSWQFGIEQLNRTFHGDEEIGSLSVVLGVLVTVTLEAVPDSRNVTLSLMVPEINLEDNNDAKASFSTVAIFTTHYTSIGGPGLVAGPLQTYEVVALEGVAGLAIS